MSELYLGPRDGPKPKYIDKASGLTDEEYYEKLKTTKTVYVGFMSYFTREHQILEYFKQVGTVRVLTMGLHKKKMLPCGFAFLEFTTHDEAERAVRFLNRTRLDGRLLKVDWDMGVDDERKFGRGDRGG